MTKMYKPDAVILCPHCSKGPGWEGDPASYYVVPGRTGEQSRSTTECVECSGLFTCETTEAGLIEVWPGRGRNQFPDVASEQQPPR